MQTETLSSLQESQEGMSDNELIAAHLNGDKEAFTEIERRYRHELLVYLWRYLRNEEAVRDVSQNIFLQVHLKCDTFDLQKKFRPWLYSIATHQAIDWRRRKSNRFMLSLDTPDLSYVPEDTISADVLPGRDLAADEILEVKEQRAAVRAAIKCLPQPIADAMHMVHWQGMKYKDVADKSGVCLNTIKARLHLGLVKLEELLGDLMKHS